MRIAILEFDPAQKSATGVRGRAIQSFLQREGHTVDVLSPGADATQTFNQSRSGILSRIKRKASGSKTLPHLWDFLADRLEPQIRTGRYDVVIGRGQDVAYVLTRQLECLKILDMANILFLEEYFVWGPNLNEVEETFKKETSLFRSVDHILSPHDFLTKFFLKQFAVDQDVSSKVETVRLGCEPAPRTAKYSATPQIVYAGSYYYIQDPYLLSSVSRVSPFPIHCFGPSNPNRAFLPAPLNYKGYAQGEDFLADYQFGLITVSRDTLRQNSPSTKFAYYFAAGLPVLFPDWMKEGHTYPDCAIPYDEDNFVTQVQIASKREAWQRMSEAALATARELTWEKVLTPLSNILSRRSTHDSAGK